MTTPPHETSRDGETRRDVLRTAGGALGATAGAAALSGGAAASHLQPGDPVHAETLVDLWEDGCPLLSGDHVGSVTEGTLGTVLEVCDDSDFDTTIEVDWEFDEPTGWCTENQVGFG